MFIKKKKKIYILKFHKKKIKIYKIINNFNLFNLIKIFI